MIQGSACELDGKKIIHDCLGVWICFGVPVILVMGTPRERERLCVCVTLLKRIPIRVSFFGSSFQVPFTVRLFLAPLNCGETE